jgi:hypothetical protein
VIVLADNGDPGPTRDEYLAQVEAVCRPYNDRLAKIPPPTAVGNPQAVAQSIERALPLVVERAQRTQAIEPPPELEDEVRRIFTLSSKAIDELRAALRSARRGDVQASATAMGRFLSASDDARAASRAIGLSC